MSPNEIKTYPEMNENIKEFLRKKDDFTSLYILARLVELERTVKELQNEKPK